MISEAEILEIDLLFEAMYRRYGYDFRNYAFASAQRRVLHNMKKNKIESIGELQHRLIHDEQVADALLIDLSINVTEMFRDPLLFKTLRNNILPALAKDEHLKIWHAGCSSGEEAYSMAILLNELGLLEKTQLYATDFNNQILKQAKKGILQLGDMRSHIKNYQSSGGIQEFTNYYRAKHGHAILDKLLKKNIMFSNHNLTGDGVFGEMNLIICRNVLIYFDKKLQNRVFELFLDSMAENGILCLGSHETLSMSSVAKQFETISEPHRIYKKKQTV